MFLTLLFLASALAGACGIVFGAGINPWWFAALVPGLFLGAELVYLLCILVISLFLPKKEPKRSSAYCRLNIRLFLAWLMRVLNVKIHLKGTELLPSEPCVLISNHRSAFDPMTVLAKLKRKKLLFISKESNFKYPIAGPFIRRAAFLPIDRENGMRALRTLKNAADRMMSEGVDFGIYPEGSRTKTGELQEFKSGAFYLAKKAEAPIVVMTARNTELVGKKPFRRVHVYLYIFAVIDKETVRATSMDDLAIMTHDMVEEHLKELSQNDK
ncbi:MAG: 1-acyl-sn-glycerol-3-phosphate acyltransferase [Clostridia bacterium]|nr:1-acyl-sn-glycerol-3-phosphate acyltransferase [Clostridia bacterium]